MDWSTKITASIATAALLLTSGCLEFDGPTGFEGRCFDWQTESYVLCGVDAMVVDATATDASGPDDAAEGDADAGLMDMGGPDIGIVDIGFPDSGVHPDAMSVDMGFPDSAVQADAMPVDMGFPDSGVHPDAMPVDVGFPDSGVHPDAMPVDVGFPDSGEHPDAQVPMVTIAIQIAGNGRGSVASFPGLDIDCHYDGAQTSGICSASFAVTDMITLEASADRFYSFNGWTNACASAGGRFCQLDFSFGNQTITAFFN